MDQSLPDHLAERARWVVSPQETRHGPGEFVLYWMHNCLRGHENPALDVAVCLAGQNGLPLLIYHGLSESYPYASDRHHTFILQGARDAQREFADLGFRYAFHLQRDGNRGPHLRDLTRRAAVLVTEEMPVPPLTNWIERLCTITTTPIVSVDSSCVVPVGLVTGNHTFPDTFREATEELLAPRISSTFPEQRQDCEPYSEALPFEPLDLQSADLSKLIGLCRINHAVAPVADSPGGSRAGYARWDRFKQQRLRDYNLGRQHPADFFGSSRLSPYLHYGMVSPFRIAREASEVGASTFLEELLIRRELAFHFCLRNGDQVESLDAVPDWARESLMERADDEREGSHSWETLARARSEDPLWDVCQQSLLRHGELRNDLRRTWGKAIFAWTDSPARTFHLSIDLNNRFALDGRDPNSYGGILWCFGQFDQPSSSPIKILGQVPSRPLDEQRKQIDLDRLRAVVTRPIAKKLPSVAIVGAGLGGLIAGRTLADHGIAVQLFDKARGVGGRLASRRVNGAVTFDHGAQYFTARDPRFTKTVQSWTHDGLVEPWIGRIVELARGGQIVADKMRTPRYVGVPSMNAIAKHIASDLSVQLRTTVTSLSRTRDERWDLFSDKGRNLGTFDVVLVNCPPPQALKLLDSHSNLSDTISGVTMLPCWCLMLQSRRLNDLPYDAAFVNDGPLSWIANNGAKPGREEGEGSTWVLHGSNDWSKEHLEEDAEQVTRSLVSAFEDQTAIDLGEPDFAIAHRWRFADPEQALVEECLWDQTAGLGVCGDWCGGPRVEGAFLSGVALAGTVLRHYTIDRAAADTVANPSLSSEPLTRDG